MRIQGIIPPVITPMQANEDLDLPRLRGFIDHLIANGVHGIFVLGTNSEFYALDEREKQEVIATAVAHVNKRVPVYAGTGAESTRETVRLTRMAEREGADGVSVITPYFVNPSQQEIADHYRRIAENTKLPVILYNNPVTCGGVKIDQAAIDAHGGAVHAPRSRRPTRGHRTAHRGRARHPYVCPGELVHVGPRLWLRAPGVY
jgi:4-hydroxy-tetrahydrodipicolinate synthase